MASKVTYSTEPAIFFSFSPQEIETLCEREKNSLLKAIDDICKLEPSKITFENSLGRLETISTEFNRTLTPATFLKYVSHDAAVRKAADACETSLSQLLVELFAREDLYRVIRTLPSDKLDAESTRLLEEYLTSFRRNGLELSSEKRAQYIEKKKRLVLIESEFANNLVNEKEALVLTAEEMEGLSDDFINSLEKTAEGNYKLTMAYPHYYTFMKEGKNGEARKKYENKFNNRGGEKNKLLLEEAISLRDELAKLLGYPSHAAFVLERRMAKKPEAVRTFLVDIANKLKEKGQSDLKELLEIKKQDPNAKDKSTIYAFDWRYYENKLKKAKYNVDSQKIKEYFPIQTVLDGMFDIYQKLLAVRFIPDEKAPVWHPDVRAFQIEKNGDVVAKFYMDLYPREGKYNHAAAFTLRSGFLRSDGKYQMPISSIVSNFNPPLANNPSLLEHSEVETLFHEFGHIMHQVLTRARFATFSGTAVKTDFVEAPSQMLENWVWQKDILKNLSGHYKNPSEKLPDELIEKMLRAKFLNVGLAYLRQVAFATIDLDFHVSAKVDTTRVYSDRMKEIMLIPTTQGTQPQASFGHLMGGYDSGYYSYLWSEVYAQDMFTRFEKEGLLSPNTGKDYAKWILEPGGSEEPDYLIKNFLGREPNSEAFLKSMGLSE